MATAKPASDLSSRPKKKPEADSSVRTSEIYAWASQLASESRRPDWVLQWYVWPDAVLEAIRKLETMSGGIVGLVGLQGVGKSSALLSIMTKKMLLQHEEYRKSHKSGEDPDLGKDMIRFKWRRRSELLPSLLNGTHELSKLFRHEYSKTLLEHLESRFKFPVIYQSEFLQARENPDTLNLDWAEKTIGRRQAERLREQVWLKIILEKRLLLIDTPDYSKTDRRLMAKDLDEIYWLWNLMSKGSTKPNIVIAIQREMFRDHFFFDKMGKVELEPLRPEQMVEAYRKRFKAIEPFTEDALLTLARMSRGIFRRFLRYITLTLTRWEIERKGPIDTAIVKEAVTVARLAEDMELELVELFPKQSGLRLQAVRLLMLLEESGPRKQSELSEELSLEAYEMSRLLAKLELHHYITRRREGTDKVVSLGTR